MFSIKLTFLGEMNCSEVSEAAKKVCSLAEAENSATLELRLYSNYNWLSSLSLGISTYCLFLITPKLEIDACLGDDSKFFLLESILN
jgi:hypothetical protein